ncbi:hypothetical protein ACVOMV_06915 [Mesorhizobium atlanticum]
MFNRKIWQAAWSVDWRKERQVLPEEILQQVRRLATATSAPEATKGSFPLLLRVPSATRKADEPANEGS